MCVDNFSLRFFMKDVGKRIRDAVLYTFNYQPFHQQTIETIG